MVQPGSRSLTASGMSTWSDVERIGLSLPDTAAGEAHEGSPAVLVRDRQFARLRWDNAGVEILQF